MSNEHGLDIHNKFNLKKKTFKCDSHLHFLDVTIYSDHSCLVTSYQKETMNMQILHYEIKNNSDPP